ncbi:MAG: ABC transporter permease [Actinomycetota bacterium]|nr:ABC transporter permease [Actinomycetota bacterium]
MTWRRTSSTATRLGRQLRHDPRSVALMLVVPCVLMTLLRYVFDAQPPVFDRIGPMLLVIFPFTVMFVISSVAMLRERTSGTLERLLAGPIDRAELVVGYGLAFGAAAVVQVGLVSALSFGLLGLDVEGSVVLLLAVAVLVALLGLALGLLVSAFARSEFQAVQFLPAIVLPQFLLCGLFVPRDEMATALDWASRALPLTYAVDAASRAASESGIGASLAVDLVVVMAAVPAALFLGAATLRRRTA